MELSFVERKLIENYRKLESREKQLHYQLILNDVINRKLFDENGNYKQGKSMSDYVSIDASLLFHTY